MVSRWDYKHDEKFILCLQYLQLLRKSRINIDLWCTTANVAVVNVAAAKYVAFVTEVLQQQTTTACIVPKNQRFK